MDAQSAIYEGTVFHERYGSHASRFEMGLFMLYLDLEELPELFTGCRFWSYQGANLGSVQRSDYLRPCELPLRQVVRDAVWRSTGWSCDGPIRLLTHGRFLGHCFNPVSLYYCFELGQDTPRCVLAEVTNTPWMERHTYVLDLDWPSGAPSGLATVDKRMHVSPFFPMDMSYRWTFGPPVRRLSVTVDLLRASTLSLRAGLRLERRPWTPRALDGVLLRYPAMAAQVVAGIYWQAFKLWRSRARFHGHP